MFFLDLVEGKDHPKEARNNKWEDTLGNTASLMMMMTTPIHVSAKKVVMDSGFCVLEGLV